MIKEINSRINGVYNDLKAFIYIRKHNLQHKEDDIGGGNITMALVLFTTLSFLGKIQYFVDKKGVVKFDSEGIPVINEEHAFFHLIKLLHANKINLGLPDRNNSILSLVWKGFRNKLAHVNTIENGKQAMSFIIGDPENLLTVRGILNKLSGKEAFEHDGSDRNWRVNVDILLANLPAICNIVVGEVKKANLEYPQLENLRKVIG